MPTAIKICGLTRLEDVRWLNRMPVDYMGFVFDPRSKRYVTPEQVSEFLERVDIRAKTVGVFFDQPLEWVHQVMVQTGLDIAQLHGDESVADAQRVLNCPVVHRVHPQQWSLADKDARVYAYLLDPGAGDGKLFDWQQLAGNTMHKSMQKCWLAGGFRVDNVAHWVRQLAPALVDVSSGVESDTPGVKDPEKITRFIERVQGAALAV